MTNRTTGLFTLALFAVASLVGIGCSSNAGPQSSLPAATVGGGSRHHHRGHPNGYGSVISHIFIIIQENRSLNNLFAGDTSLSGANTTLTGYEKVGSKQVQVQLSPENLGGEPQDIDHCYYDAEVAIDGSSKPMDGFNNEYLGDPCGTTGKLAKLAPYAYVQQSAKSDVQPYWDIANNWVLGANFYPTELGPSFVAHLNLIASTTEYKALTAVGDFPPSEPWGCGNVAKPPMRYVTPTVSPHPFQTGPPPCYDQFHTVADLLDCIYPSESNCSASNPVPWRYYAPGVKNSASTGYIWSAFQAIKRVYGNGKGQDWKNDVISPPGKIFHAISSGALDNIGVTWIVPESAWSDHAGMDTDEGPSWVADITNAIGARTSLWNHSVIVVVWDDWGGWYDNAPPPTLTWGMGGLGQYYRGYGIRTPLLILSPYAKQGQDSGHVSLRSFESGSILKFIEQVFNFNSAGLAALPCKSSDYSYYSCDIQYTDASSNSIGYVLDTSQSPRAYGTPIPTKYPPSKFMSGSGYYNYAVQAPDNE